MQVDFRIALAKLVPIFMPDILFRLHPDGQPVFPEFAQHIQTTEFAPGIFHGGGTMKPIDYMVALSDLKITPPSILISQPSSNKYWPMDLDFTSANTCHAGRMIGKK